MKVELTKEQLKVLTDSLAFREAKVWDMIGELNKQNENKIGRQVQEIADACNDLRLYLSIQGE